jgi:hypothetical protein
MKHVSSRLATGWGCRMGRYLGALGLSVLLVPLTPALVYGTDNLVPTDTYTI